MTRARRSLSVGSIDAKATVVPSRLAAPHSAMRPAPFVNISRVLFAASLLSICVFASAPARSATANHAPDFLVHGNVFDSRGFTVANARIRMSRAGKTSWRWETNTDGEGEFALHVPAEVQYVLRVDAKGYPPLIQNVDASQDIRVDLSLHLVARGGGKPQ
jgi:hypothetical protein